MSTKIGLGQSHEASEIEAGKEAMTIALHALSGLSPDVVFVYSTFGFDFPSLIHSIRAMVPGVRVIGGSTLGIITREGPDTEFHRVSVCAIKSDDFIMTPLVAKGLIGRSGAAGRELAAQIEASGKNDIKGLYLFLDGLHAADPDSLLREVEHALPPATPVFGGTASEPLLWKNTYQFYDDEVLEDAAVGVLFSGKINIAVTSSHGSQELGAVHEVTKADGARIYEIDNKPAMHLFTELYGAEQKQISAAMAAGVCLGVRVPEEVVGGERMELRVPLTSLDDGSIIMAAAWPTGTKIYVCQRNGERIIDRADSAAKELVAMRKGIQPLVVFHADCVGRSADQVGKDVAFSEVRATIDAFPQDTPWFGAYVYGELASVGGKAAFHNWTGAIASMYIE
ncbi:MAG TPA: FIST N-terminal domain-containing protein [Candidatus Paceibacterota bacterium]|nr:FIST N-terminal domain-containing protein [Candidatus Paceibacterota bacterium]